MTRYNDSIGRLTSPACEVCGQAMPTHLERHVDNGSCYDVRPHASNRVKVDTYYAQHSRVNRPELAGKYLCADCYEQLILTPLNK